LASLKVARGLPAIGLTIGERYGGRVDRRDPVGRGEDKLPDARGTMAPSWAGRSQAMLVVAGRRVEAMDFDASGRSSRASARPSPTVRLAETDRA
jgi:hypothetical protein